jgi:uncharacterized protein
MLLVKTRLGISSIHGVGLFADEFISEGVVVWRYHPVIDIRLSAMQIEDLAAACCEQIRKYTYREKHTGLYVLCGDDARFFNHSAEPNCLDVFNGDEEDVTVALRGIRCGEELTCDYSLFDMDLVEGRYKI